MSQTLSALRACRTSPWLGLEGELGVDIRTCPLSYLLRQHQLTPWCLSRPWMLCPEAGESWGRIEVGGCLRQLHPVQGQWVPRPEMRDKAQAWEEMVRDTQERRRKWVGWPGWRLLFIPKVHNILPHPWLHLKLPKLGRVLLSPLAQLPLSLRPWCLPLPCSSVSLPYLLGLGSPCLCPLPPLLAQPSPSGHTGPTTTVWLTLAPGPLLVA